MPSTAQSRPCEPFGGDSKEKARSPPRLRARATRGPVRPSDQLHRRRPRVGRRQLRELHEQAPFDVANVEVRWADLSPELVRDSLRRLMEEVMPLLELDPPAPSDMEANELMNLR